MDTELLPGTCGCNEGVVPHRAANRACSHLAHRQREGAKTPAWHGVLQLWPHGSFLPQGSQL